MSNPRNQNDAQKPANDAEPLGAERDPIQDESSLSSDIVREAAQIAALHEEIADLKDRYLRAAAETENVRRRAEREKAEAGQFAFARFAGDLLNVIDNFSRAFEALKPEVREALPAAAMPVIEGIEATQRELLAILERHGIKRIEAKGQCFNPNLHRAIAEVATDEYPPGTIIEVAQQGYTIGTRLLREAYVAVVAQPKAKNGASKQSGSSLDTSA